MPVTSVNGIYCGPVLCFINPMKNPALKATMVVTMCGTIHVEQWSPLVSNIADIYTLPIIGCIQQLLVLALFGCIRLLIWRYFTVISIYMIAIFGHPFTIYKPKTRKRPNISN